MNTQTKQSDTAPERTMYKYRYFCDGCTNIAFYGTERTGWTGKRSCNHCGIATLEYKPENWLELSPEQYKEVNHQL